MLISLKWIRDFVDLPDDLDPRSLAERITVTTAEVDGITPVQSDARGLIVARLEAITELPGTRNLHKVVLDVGSGKTVESVTAAPTLHQGYGVVYAPPGAHLGALGDMGEAKVAGTTSVGMIIPSDAVGMALAAQEAVFVDKSMAPGEPVPSELFDDWLIEIDNKSITNRPDLWGHYGIAREIAAIYGLPLKPYPIEPLENLTDDDMPVVDIDIADADACRRYSGIVLEGVPIQPAPLWMQLRLGHVGMRPISGLVDLTNYIMADLGQPMHAFDAARVTRIEVDWAKPGEVFRTLDGVDRTLGKRDLMIQCEGRSIALAGVMGGLETEVSDATSSLLLESANFDPATIRRTATRLGLRTDASARFEKSLDPVHTVLAIQRFIQLARPMYPEMTLASRLSDGYPKPQGPLTVAVDPTHVSRTIGREVDLDEASRILEPLGFRVTAEDSQWRVLVPTFRATNDISIEADVVEEIARYVGYGSIKPAMPQVTMRRFEPHALHELEQRALEYFTGVHRFHEIQGYLWYDTAWLARLGVNPGPCIELANPAAEGLHLLRRTLMPGLLAAVELNRFHFPAFSIIELGSVFEKNDPEDREYRHVGLVDARRGKKAEDDLYHRLKGTLEGWAWDRFGRTVNFAQAAAHAQRPWEHPHRTATILVDGSAVGRISVVDLAIRRAMDEHLASWSIAWAELRLSGLEGLSRRTEPLGAVPPFPLVELDTSFLVPASTRYAEVVAKLGAFDHPLLKSIRFVGSYQGDPIPADRRSLSFRTVVGDNHRTLTDADTNTFRQEFERFLAADGYEIRR